MKNLSFEQALEQLKKGATVAREAFASKKQIASIVSVGEKVYWNDKAGKRQGTVLFNLEDKEAKDWYVVTEAPAAPAPAATEKAKPSGPAAPAPAAEANSK